MAVAVTAQEQTETQRFVRDGDTLVATKADRVARSTRDLLDIVDQLSKRGNMLRVVAEAVRWAKRGPGLNCISPGIIITPLAKDELSGPRGESYKRMIALSPVGRGQARQTRLACSAPS